AAGNRNLPSGEFGIFGARGLRGAVGNSIRSVSGFAGGNGFTYHDGQCAWRIRMGRRRNRSRSGDAGPAKLNAGARSGWIQTARKIAGRRDGNGPGADRDGDAAEEGRGW